MPEATLLSSALKIEGLSLFVNLGCSAEERGRPQEVRVSLELRFGGIPRGASTDSLGDTICYGRIVESIQDHCATREYHLIEKMAHDLYGLVREVCGAGVAVGISVHKVRPPLPNLLGGAIFRCGDFAP